MAAHQGVSPWRRTISEALRSSPTIPDGSRATGASGSRGVVGVVACGRARVCVRVCERACSSMSVSERVFVCLRVRVCARVSACRCAYGWLMQ